MTTPMTLDEVCRKNRIDMGHGTQVADLSAELFTITRPIHQLPDIYREVSYHAGLLHNVAAAKGRKKHHTRGRDIILNTPIKEIANEDRAIIAVTTALHRKRWQPDRLENEPSYTVLDSAQQNVARWLSALVRIADGMDYSHSQATTIDEAEVSDRGVKIILAGPYTYIDAPRGHQKADMWRAVFNLKFKVK